LRNLPCTAQSGFRRALGSPSFSVCSAIFIYRVGTHIPVPGIKTRNQLTALFNQNQGTILGLFNMFSGGALGAHEYYGIGIMPYISASIIMQLMTAR